MYLLYSLFCNYCMPHPGACLWFAMCLAGWCSGRRNCLPKPCTCWQANSCLVICSLVCTNSGCLHSLLKAACFFFSSWRTFCPACQTCVPATPLHFPATLTAGLPQPWPCGTQVSEVLPEDTMVTADMQALGCSEQANTKLRIAPHSLTILTACAKWSDSETTAASLLSWTIPNAFLFVSSSTLLSSLVIWQGKKCQKNRNKLLVKD